MSRQYFAAPDSNDFPPADLATVNTSSVITNLWSPSIWSPIPANDGRAGKAYEIRAGAVLSTTASGPTVIFTPTFGAGAASANTSLGASITFTLAANLSNVPVFLEFVGGFRQIGVAASGATFAGNGVVFVGGAAAAASTALAIGGTVIASADQTTAQGLSVGITFGTSNAGNTITTRWAQIRSLN